MPFLKTKCFVKFLDVHFNSNKRITRANQNSRLSTYNITNLILKNIEWMIYKSTFLMLSASFYSTSCCFSSGNFWDNFKFRCFLAWGFVFVLLCSFTKKKTDRTSQCFPRLLSRHFPPCFDHVLLCSPSGVHCLIYHDRDTFDLSQGHVTKNQPMAVPV